MRPFTIVLTCFLITQSAFSQKKRSTKIGTVSDKELQMTRYDKDTIANAVILLEHANYYIDEKRDYKKRTDFYYKVKILNKDGFSKATIEIPFFDKEKVINIKGITSNLSDKSIQQNHLIDSKVYEKNITEKWKEITFTLPNVKIGSVIEYSYSVISPYSKIDDWNFQSDIPKKESNFTAAILGNWKYNIRLTGFQDLFRDNPSVKRNCVNVPGIGNGDCLSLDYSMKNIPSFKEEDYMLSKENYISKLTFDLKSFTDPKGHVKKYTKTWKDADKRLKYDFLDNQTSKKKYFKKNLNPTLFLIKNPTEKAIKVYQSIQNHFTWNGKYWPSKKVRVKDAFEEKSGTVFDINLALYNSLQAADIESYLVLSSTRNKAIPTKIHPIINDFNYLLVKAVINNKVYFLDATNKHLPFGMVEYLALNGDGRIMDFKNGSYWEPIQLSKRSSITIKAILELKDNVLSGDLIISNNGYFAVNTREKISNTSTDDFIDDFESEHPNLEIDSFEFENLNQNNKPLIQTSKVTFDDLNTENNFVINPFLINKYTVNPFKLNERKFPVNYGYPTVNTYILSLKLPEGYVVDNLPKKKIIALPNKGGRFMTTYKYADNNTITVYSRISINKKSYSSDEYYYLKEFYNQIIKLHDTFIKIKKVTN